MNKVEFYIAELQTWAAQQGDIQGILLVGSHARTQAKPTSDIDLCIIVDNPDKYLSSTSWATQFGDIENYKIEHYGNVTSLRIYYKNGIEVEYGFTTPAWADLPVDPGTKQVILDGAKILYDQQETLYTLIKHINAAAIQQRYTGCIVLTYDNKLLLQHRPDNWQTFPDMVATFGGHVEDNEAPMQAITRELNEEIGAKANTSDLISLGAITEHITQYSELVYLYFWHDLAHTITGCYECQPQYFSNLSEALKHPKLMDDVRWALMQCQSRELIK